LAGHSKWAQIKRKKEVNDKRRGAVISKHIRAIQAAVRAGGSSDPQANLALKNALAAAKADTVPQDNIDRAIERASGSGEGGGYEAVVYEGYAPGGTAILIEALTDNRNRTVAEVRHVLSKHGGNLSGSVAWQFEPTGVIVVADTSEQVQELAIELGAEDLETDDERLTVYTDPAQLYAVADGLQAAGVEIELAQLTKRAQNTVQPSPEDAGKIMGLLEALEDLDDVQNVYSTADLEQVAELA
jgi:YebC/PmpR family DNA-binding regulatory protein